MKVGRCGCHSYAWLGCDYTAGSHFNDFLNRSDQYSNRGPCDPKQCALTTGAYYTAYLHLHLPLVIIIITAVI